jgi:hypothetical protein
MVSPTISVTPESSPPCAFNLQSHTVIYMIFLRASRGIHENPCGALYVQRIKIKWWL